MIKLYLLIFTMCFLMQIFITHFITFPSSYKDQCQNMVITAKRVNCSATCWDTELSVLAGKSTNTGNDTPISTPQNSANLVKNAFQ